MASSVPSETENRSRFSHAPGGTDQRGEGRGAGPQTRRARTTAARGHGERMGRGPGSSPRIGAIEPSPMQDERRPGRRRPTPRAENPLCRRDGRRGGAPAGEVSRRTPSRIPRPRRPGPPRASREPRARRSAGTRTQGRGRLPRERTRLSCSGRPRGSRAGRRAGAAGSLRASPGRPRRPRVPAAASETLGALVVRRAHGRPGE